MGTKHHWRRGHVLDPQYAQPGAVAAVEQARDLVATSGGHEDGEPRAYGRQVSAFEPDDEFRNPADFQLLQNGHVALYLRVERLRRAVDSLQVLGYQVVELDAAAWRTTAEMHVDLAARLGFPSSSGHTLDALSDSLGDVASYHYAARAADTGLALVLTGFDSYARAEPRDAQIVVDILEGAGRRGLLFGHRLLFLLQIDRPGLVLGPVGAVRVSWGPEEGAQPSLEG